MDGLGVEFVSDGPPPGLPGGGAGGRRVPALAVCALAIVFGLLIAVQHTDRSVTGRPISAVAAAVCTTCVSYPSNAIVALFAQDLPGAVVTDERSTFAAASSYVHRVLRWRTVTAVYGNVVMTVTIQRFDEDSSAPAPAPAPGPAPTPAVRLVRGGYEVMFSFTGYYPPTGRQLTTLADDPRITSALS